MIHCDPLRWRGEEARPLHGIATTPDAPHWYDALPCYLSVQDDQLRIIETNELFRRDFSAAPGDFCYRAYKHRDEPCRDCPVIATFATGKNHTSRESVVTKGGRELTVAVTSSPLFDEHGHIVAVVEMFTDITEIEALHREVRRSRYSFRRLFDIVPCYISIQDRGFRITEANKLFRQDFGERKGDRCYEAYKGGDAICDRCPVEQSFADGKVHSSEETVVTRDGQEASVVVTSMPIHDEGGEVTAVMEVSTNVTEVKRLQSLATVGLAVTGMAHRMKNILMGLKGGVFVVDDGFEIEDDDAVLQGWHTVKRNVDRMSRVALDLLFCSKDREPSLEDGVSPESIAEEVYDLYRLRAAADSISLRLDIGPTPHQGLFDPEALHNLMINLVANAVDACRFDPAADHKQHEIVMSCHQADDGATVIEVADNGAGIPDDEAPKVLQGFYSTKGTEGTGLGLLVVQKVVQEHCGTFTFTTAEGQGTTFTVVIPRRSDTKERGGGTATASISTIKPPPARRKP